MREKMKYRKILIAILLAVSCSVCLSVGMANTKVSEADADETVSATSSETGTGKRGYVVTDVDGNILEAYSEDEYGIMTLDGTYKVTEDTEDKKNKTTTVTWTWSEQKRKDVDGSTKTVTDYAWTECSGFQTNVTVPYYCIEDTHGGAEDSKYVTAIGDSLFYNQTSIKTVTINSSDIVYIGSSAFNGCTSLTTVSGNVPYIGPYAFSGCTKLTTVDLAQNSYTTNGYIANDAFYNCTSLSSFEFASDVKYYTQIGREAFYNTALEEVSIGVSVTSLGNYAFYGCSKLESVYIYTTAMTGAYMFENCTSLTYASVKSELVTNSSFYGCTSLKNVLLGSGVTSIGNYAFCDCSALDDVIVSETLESIGNRAFQGDTSLTTFETSSNVQLQKLAYIGEYAFDGCTGLVKFYPEYDNGGSGNFTYYVSLATIGSYAFRNCTSLTGFMCNLSDNVAGLTIGSYAFDGCTSLTGVFTGSKQIISIGSYAFRNTACANVTNWFSSAATQIGEGAFAGCSKLTSVYLPFVGGKSSASSSSESTCFGYIFGTTSMNGTTATTQKYTSSKSVTYYIPTSLTSVTINGGKIFYGAFYGCSNITTLSLSSGVTTIGDYAFYNCSALTTITIPDSVTSIENYAFYNCTHVTSLTYGAANATVTASTSNNVFANLGAKSLAVTINSTVTSIPGYLFYNNTSITTLTLTNATKLDSIGSYAFYGCTNLNQALELPESVTEIGAYAFYGDTKLSGLKLGGSVKTVESYAFNGCTGISGDVTIPDTCTVINNYAFYNCSEISEITLGTAVASIGIYAFYGNTKVTTLKFNAKSMSDLGSKNNVFYNLGTSGSGITVTIGASVTRIPAYLFNPADSESGAPNIIRVVIEANSSLKESGADSFRYLTKLTILNIGEMKYFSVDFENEYANPLMNVSNVANGDALVGNINLKNTELTETNTKGVNSIGTYAFAYCSMIKSIHLGDTIATIGACAFLGMEDKDIKLPSYSGWDVCASSTTYSGTRLEAGDLETNLKLYLCDTYCSYTWRWTEVNTIKPVITGTIGENEIESGTFTREGSVSFDVQIAVSTSGLRLSQVTWISPDGKENNPTTNTFTINFTTEGEYQVYAVDSDGVKSEVFTVVYDVTAPGLYIGGAAAWSNWSDYNSAEFSVVGLDTLYDYSTGKTNYFSEGVTIYYSDTGADGSWYICPDNPFTVTPGANNYYTKGWSDGYWWFKAVDAAGNETNAYKTIIDTVEVFGEWGRNDSGDPAFCFMSNMPSYSSWKCELYKGDGTLLDSDYDENDQLPYCNTDYYVILYSANGSTPKTYSTHVDHVAYSELEYHNPTCTSNGYWEGSCPVCMDYIYEEDPDTQCGHSYIEYSQPLDCEHDGYLVWVCEYCGLIDIKYYEGTNGHNNSEWETIFPTCGEQGYTEFKCSKCGKSMGTGFYTDPLGHDFENGEIIEDNRPADCSGETGYYIVQCSRCEATQKYEITASDTHFWNEEYGTRVEPTCTVDGYVIMSCTKCGATETFILEALGHDYGEGVPSGYCGDTFIATCTREGCGETAEFQNTSSSYVAHTWNENEDYRAPTCEELGYRIRYCDVCGYEEVSYMAALGHNWSEGVESTEIRYDEEGNEYTAKVWIYTCTRDGCDAISVIDYTTATDTATGVIGLFKSYQSYIWYILLALVAVWSIVIGCRFIFMKNNDTQEKAKTHSMLANYLVGLFVIAIICVAVPFLIYGIAVLVG